jgi:hypothetical protein
MFGAIRVVLDQSAMRMILTPLSVGMAVFLCPFASAQESIKSCAAIEVRSVRSSAEVQHKHVQNARPEITESVTSETGTKAVLVVANGPVLGSMDSPNIAVDVTCTPKGAAVTATITRSANYNGAALQNVIWRPHIQIIATLLKSQALFKTTWRMRLTTGKEVDRAETPGYPSQTYPNCVIRVLRMPDARSVVGTGSGRITVHPEVIPGQKSACGKFRQIGTGNALLATLLRISATRKPSRSRASLDARSGRGPDPKSADQLTSGL